MLYTVVSDRCDYEQNDGKCYEMSCIPYHVTPESSLIYEVRIPLNADMRVGNNCIHASSMILSNPIFLDDFIRDHSLWSAILQHNGMMLSRCWYKSIITREDYETALRSAGLALQFVPRNRRTKQLCEIALRQNGMAIQYVPKQTEHLCWIALLQIPDAIEFIKQPTHEQCVYAVQKRGYLLRHIRPEFQTEQLCLDAVTQFGFTLKYVVAQTPEICKKAIDRCGFALIDVHKQTDEIVLYAIRKDPHNLQYVLQKTPEHCALALQGSGFALRYIPADMMNEICTCIVNNRVNCIYFDSMCNDLRYIEEWKRGYMYGCVATTFLIVLLWSIYAWM